MTNKKSSEIIIPEGRDLIEAITSGQLSFTDAMANADQVIGSNLLNNPGELVGVPFAIIGGTFREGFTREIAGVKVKGDYVSLEILVADEATMERMRIPGDGKSFRPSDILRFNDGSTGVRRQIVAYLAAKGYVTLSDTPLDEMKHTGKLGESDFDAPVGMWKDVHHGEMTFNNEGHAVYDFNIPRMLYAMRGLRESVYKNDNGDVVTRYLA